MENFLTEADYVIVGAGSAGCALAGRLSEDGRSSVILSEAGPPANLIWTKIPIGYGKTFYDPRVNWMYQTEPVPGFGGRPNYWPRGRVVGGSSAINAMVYARGQPSDFDAWEAAGNPGWGWKDVLAAYRRMEDHDLGASDLHGAGGPLHVTVIDRWAHALTRRFVEAGTQLGLPATPDLNGESIEGVGYYQITTRRGLRESSATAYLRRRPNLRVVTNSQVKRILTEGRRATGVVTEGPAGETTFRARRAVILSAGSIGSPLLLQLSGIGPGALLQRLSLPVVHESAMVGRNLQDHLCYDHYYRATEPSLNQVLRPWTGKLRVALHYLLSRRGPLSMSLNQGGGFYRSDASQPVPDIQLYFSPLTYQRAPVGIRPLMSPDPFPGFSTSISPCKPRSLGHIELAAPDWRAAPLIQPNALSDPHDMVQMLAGARFLRRLAETPALGSVISEEMKPGRSTESDAEFEADIRARSYSVFHPCGTCRMGPDPATSVVDADLRVHGFEGLHVADASIFPDITSGNLNAPSIMVGEMAAQRIARLG
ncbi:MAG: dependent oxidoreductase family protein [Rhizobium sp.]|nr:dependent oxidoreductase family protein [Rhizobium sp.]